MLLSDLIKSLTDIAIDCGECEVVINIKDSSKSYTEAILHYLPFEQPILRLEGIDAEDYKKIKESDLNE